MTHASIECLCIEIDGVGAWIEGEILLVATGDDGGAEWDEIGGDARWIDANEGGGR